MLKIRLIRILFVYAAVLLIGLPVQQAFAAKKKSTAPAKSSSIARSPYLGAICVDAATGKVLFEDNPDAHGYPASMIKLMDLMVILDQLKAKAINLDDKVTVTAEASRIGGSQVFLKENEVFTVDDLLYALMVQSANDAAVALALHVAGSKEGFVDMMNEKAKQLGMTNTTFYSPHGLPPGKDQKADVSTPRDMAKLCMELLKYADTIRYTSTKERPFRADSPQPFIMRSHNHLLGHLEGCDGLKTGFYFNAGFSISATASRRGNRAIAVIFGSVNRKERDAKAKELLSRGLIDLAKLNPPPAPPVVAQVGVAGAPAVPPAGAAPVAAVPAPAVVTPPAAPAVEKAALTPETESDVIKISKSSIKIFFGCLLGIILIFVIIAFILKQREKNRPIYYRTR